MINTRIDENGGEKIRTSDPLRDAVFPGLCTRPTMRPLQLKCPIRLYHMGNINLRSLSISLRQNQSTSLVFIIYIIWGVDIMYYDLFYN